MSIPNFVPLPVSAQAERESAMWRASVAALDVLRAETFRLLGLTDPATLALRRKFEWDAYTQREWHQAVNDFLETMQGRASMVPAGDGWYYSQGVLPEHWRLATSAGLEHGAVLTGIDEAALTLETLRPEVVREFGENAFARLSDQGQSRLRNILVDEERPGGSVQSIIARGQAEGLSPNEIAKQLGEQFDHYKDWEFARLARTETSFAFNDGTRDELRAEGYNEIAVEYPPLHPNCVCGIGVDMDLGVMIAMIAGSACDLCQEVNAVQEGMLNELRAERASQEQIMAAVRAVWREWAEGQGTANPLTGAH